MYSKNPHAYSVKFLICSVIAKKNTDVRTIRKFSMFNINQDGKKSFPLETHIYMLESFRKQLFPVKRLVFSFV